MITHFKSALNQIEAEEILVCKTEDYLRETLIKKQKSNAIKCSKYSLFAMNKFAIAVAFLVVFFGGGTGAYAYYKTPVAYVSLDINPSVELGVNAFNKVVKVEGYNDDGEKILIGIDVKGASVAEAIKTLIASANDNGYISDDGSTVISLTSETDDSKVATKLETDSETGANEALKENGKIAIIYKDSVHLSLNEEANTLGITAGKLNLIRKLQTIDPTATVEQYKNESVKNIMRTIQENNSDGNINNEGKGYEDRNKEGTESQKDSSTLDKNKEGTESQKDGSTLDKKKEGIENQNDGSTLDKNKEDIESQKDDSTFDKNKEGIENQKDDSTLDKNNEGTENQKGSNTTDKKDGGPTNNNNKGVVEKNPNMDNGNASNKTITNGNDHN